MHHSTEIKKLRYKSIRLRSFFNNTITEKSDSNIFLGRENNNNTLLNDIHSFLNELIESSKYVNLESDYVWICREKLSWELILRSYFLDYTKFTVPFRDDFITHEEKEQPEIRIIDKQHETVYVIHEKETILIHSDPYGSIRVLKEKSPKVIENIENVGILESSAKPQFLGKLGLIELEGSTKDKETLTETTEIPEGMKEMLYKLLIRN